MRLPLRGFSAKLHRELWVDAQLFTVQVVGRPVTQADRYFQVLTKAVGMREYGTVVTLLQLSDEGS